MILARLVCWVLGHSYDVVNVPKIGDIYMCRYCPACFTRYSHVTVTEHPEGQSYQKEIGT